MMPFKPVLSARPQMQKNALFVPIALGLFFVLFLILGFSIQDVFIPLIISAPLAIAGAWALVGWPVFTQKDGKPLIAPQAKPYLFFPVAFLFAVILYTVIGVIATKAGLAPKWLVMTSMSLSIAIACATAYFLVGFPRFIRTLRNKYNQLPAERKPFLFFPVFAVIFLVLYIGLGVGTTAALGKFADKVVLLLNIQVLLLLPFTLLASAFLSYLLVGFPKPQKSLSQSIPRVPGNRRPHVFGATFIAGGLILTVIVGAILTSVSKADGTSKAFLPDDLLLPLAVLLGYSLSLGLAVAMWGTSARWKKYDDYTPGLTPRARIGAAGGAGLAVALAVVVGFGVAGIDIFWGLLLGAILGIAVGLFVSGFHKRVASRRGEGTLLPELPDRAKSLVLLTTWFVLALVIMSVLTYALPDIVGWNFLIGLTVGLVVAFSLVEQGLVQQVLAERKLERGKRKAWQKRRKEALARGSIDNESSH